MGIISAEGVWTVPISEKNEDTYSVPGGAAEIILNNVAIWTTKGFFSVMSYKPKVVLSGSVITMDSMFGKVYHESYENFGECFIGHSGSRSPISGLGATDLCYRANNQAGTMAPNREAFVYTKMFRGDDRTTSNIIEGPPPHFPVYFENIYEKNCPLEYALKYIEYLRPFVSENRKIPEAILNQLKKILADGQVK